MLQSILRFFSYLIVGPAVVVWSNWNSTPVTVPQEALIRGVKAAHSIYCGSVDFDKYPVTNVTDKDTEWVISFGLSPVPPSPEVNGFSKHTVWLGGGGPEIRINKVTGKITYWALQK